MNVILEEAGDLPREIFLWTLKDDGELDEYQGIVNFQDIDKFPVYHEGIKSNFGIRMVRHSEGRITVNTKMDLDKVVTVVKSGFKVLLDGIGRDGSEAVETYP